MIATCVDGAGTDGDEGAGESHEPSHPLLTTGGFGADGGGFGMGGATSMPSELKRSTGAAFGAGRGAGAGAGAAAATGRGG